TVACIDVCNHLTIHIVKHLIRRLRRDLEGVAGRNLVQIDVEVALNIGFVCDKVAINRWRLVKGTICCDDAPLTGLHVERLNAYSSDSATRAVPRNPRTAS